MNRNRVSILLQEGRAFLKENNVGEYALDAALFMMEATSMSKVELYTKDLTLLSPEQEAVYQGMLARRAAGEPTQYILGRCEFMALPFIVGPGVLIPRPDTETLVYSAIECIEAYGLQSALDVGTGSGCIAVSLCVYGKIKVTAVDISERAVAFAKKNSALNQVEQSMQCLQSNLYQALAGKKFDLIVSNPPYIPTGEIEGLMREVREFEPRNALDGGTDGLSFYRSLVQGAKEMLSYGGFLLFEIGAQQGVQISRLLEENQFVDVCVKKDLAGLDRVVQGRYKTV